MLYEMRPVKKNIGLSSIFVVIFADFIIDNVFNSNLQPFHNEPTSLYPVNANFIQCKSASKKQYKSISNLWNQRPNLFPLCALCGYPFVLNFTFTIRAFDR